jgi:hypothetical protein
VLYLELDHMAVLHGVFASITGRVAVVRRLCTGFAMLPVVKAFERIPRRLQASITSVGSPTASP